MQRCCANNRAQALIELAVFGAILIFLIGAIVRQGLNSTQIQNQNLKAMRKAMEQSYLSGKADIAARNSASFLIVEDRLSAEFNKVGTMSRIPTLAQANATASVAQMLPVDICEFHNLPIFDFYVNGQHIALRSSNFVMHEYDFDSNTQQTMYFDVNGQAPNFSQQTNGVQFINFRPSPVRGCPALVTKDERVKTFGEGQLRAQGKKDGEPFEWFEKCIEREDGSYDPCRVFYEIVARTQGNVTSGEFCWHNNPSDLEGYCRPGGLLTIEQKFDLNRNGFYGDDPQLLEDRKFMAWQWGATLGVMGNKDLAIDADNGNFPIYDVDGDKRMEIIYAFGSDFEVDPPEGDAVAEADLQNHFKNFSPEHQNRIRRSAGLSPAEASGRVGVESLLVRPITWLVTLDQEEGDIDFSVEEEDFVMSRLRPGFKSEADIFTLTNDGTYLRIEEGKQLVDPKTGFRVRSTNSKDQVDLIARQFRLSNHTGFMCDDVTGAKSNFNEDVQACGSCFDQISLERTCFDKVTDVVEVDGQSKAYEGYMLHIRSKIKDERKRTWITDITKDAVNNAATQAMP